MFQAMPYGLILPVSTIVLVLRYTISAKAPDRSKYIVGGLSGASFVFPSLFPFLFQYVGLPAYVAYAPMLLQFGVCIFVLFYRIVASPQEDERQPLNQTKGK